MKILGGALLIGLTLINIWKCLSTVAYTLLEYNHFKKLLGGRGGGNVPHNPCFCQPYKELAKKLLIEDWTKNALICKRLQFYSNCLYY